MKNTRNFCFRLSFLLILFFAQIDVRSSRFFAGFKGNREKVFPRALSQPTANNHSHHTTERSLAPLGTNQLTDLTISAVLSSLWATIGP